MPLRAAAASRGTKVEDLMIIAAFSLRVSAIILTFVSSSGTKSFRYLTLPSRYGLYSVISSISKRWYP